MRASVRGKLLYSRNCGRETKRVVLAYSAKNGVQEAMQNILYTQLHSNAMNGLGTGASITTNLAYWKIILIVVNVVVVVGIAVWGTVVILQSKRKNKS